MEEKSYQQKIKDLVSFIDGLNSIQQGNFDKAKECLDLLSNFKESLEHSTQETPIPETSTPELTPPDYENIIKNSNDGIEALKEILRKAQWTPSLKACLSKVIMAWLRSIYIYVNNSYIQEFDSLPAVTINPDVKRVKAERSEGDKDKDNDKEYTKIYANSFGPCDSEFFFSYGNHYRIVWLLKEPLILRDNFMKWEENPDYGGHDQADDYGTWEKIETEEVNKKGTKHKLVEYTKTLLEQLKDEPMGYDDVMKHICILEVNLFPGFAFKKAKNRNKSDDKGQESSLVKWHELNEALLQKLVNFYNPQILIGGGTLEYYLPPKNYDTPNYKEIYKMINNGFKIVNDEIVAWSYNIAGSNPPTKSSENNGEEKVGKNIRYYGKLEDRIYIQANHPSAWDWDFNPDYAIADAVVINEWIWRDRNENGLIKSPTV